MLRAGSHNYRQLVDAIGGRKRKVSTIFSRKSRVVLKWSDKRNDKDLVRKPLCVVYHQLPQDSGKFWSPDIGSLVKPIIIGLV
jgi:hypothetical protein